MPTEFVVSRQSSPRTVRRARELRRRVACAEVVLWEVLRARRLDGVKFCMQHPVGPYLVEFYAPRFRVAVEIGGPDCCRRALLALHKVMLVRLKEDEVLRDLPGCLRRIRAALEEPLPL
jgi:very-short-patch-repair endonuclease